MEIVLEHWYQIAGVLSVVITVMVSPVVVYRWLVARNELNEIQTFVQKNKVIREEIAEINAELSKQAARIRELELALHREQLHVQRLEVENIALVNENRRLRDQIDDQ